MSINQENYEQFFLDHAEGNLSPEMEKELAVFLEANPDLKSLLDDFDPSPLQTTDIRNEMLKARLKKQIIPTEHIGDFNVDEWLIREVEGLLDEAEENELREFLSMNPAYGYDHKLFSLTKLVPDLSISYIRKNELKKRGVLLPVSRLAWLIPAAAAVILLFIGIRFFLAPDINPEPPAHQPVAEIPPVLPYQAPVSVTIPAAKQEIKAVILKSAEKTYEILRAIPFRLEPVEIRACITDNPPVGELALTNAGQRDLPVSTVAGKEPSLIARVFDNMLDRARDGINIRTKPDQVSKPGFNLWTVAEAGINGFNSISDREIELYLRKDEDGKVKSYALVEQDRLILAKELNKE